LHYYNYTIQLYVKIESFFDEIDKIGLSKKIQFRKKFSFENIRKIISDFLQKITNNWLIRISYKWKLLIRGISKLIKALQICRKKFKSILKFK